MQKIKTIFPVILAVPKQERNLKGKNKVNALSALARAALKISCQKSGIIPGDFTKDQNDAPVPFDGNFWSLTHKSEYVGGVVSGKETGIDIEKIKPVSKALMNKVAGPEEWALSDSDKEIIFFRFWTSKEAVLKASGKGIIELSDCRIEKIINDKSINVSYKNKTLNVVHYYFDGHIASIVNDGCEIEWTLLKDTVNFKI